MSGQALTIVVLAIGTPASLVRLWVIWWRSPCVDCGLEHRTCACPSKHHTMRPRR